MCKKRSDALYICLYNEPLPEKMQERLWPELETKGNTEGSLQIQDSPNRIKGENIHPCTLSEDNLVLHTSEYSSVTQLCPTLCDPMEWSIPGLPVHHQLSEFTQTHVHRVSDAIQPSHPLSSPSPPVFNLSQHWGLFQCVSSSHQVAKVLKYWLFATPWTAAYKAPPLSSTISQSLHKFMPVTSTISSSAVLFSFCQHQGALFQWIFRIGFL